MLIPLLAALAAPSPSPFIDPWPDLRLVGWWSRERTDSSHLAAPLDARVLRPAGRGVSLSLEWRFDDGAGAAPLDAGPHASLDASPYASLDLLDPLDADPLDADPLDADPLDLDDPWFAPDAFAGLPLVPPGAPGGADDDGEPDEAPPPDDLDPDDGSTPDPDRPERVTHAPRSSAGWASRLTRARRALATARSPLDIQHARIDLDEARHRLALRAAEARP